MNKTSKLALIAAVAALVASPALAQRYERPSAPRYVRTLTSPHWGNPNSPALTGGGSLGGNELNHDNTQ